MTPTTVCPFLPGGTVFFIETVTIRVDTTTQKGSVIDVVRMVLQCNSSGGNTCATSRMTIPSWAISLPNAKALVEIVFFLPGKIARDFRSKSAAKVCRLLGGDSTLISEIEQRCTQLESSAEGRATQAFLLGGSSEGSPEGSGRSYEVEIYQGMPTGFRFLADSQLQLVAEEVVDLSLERERQALESQKQALKRQRVEDLVGRYTLLQDIEVELDDRTKVEIRDKVSLVTKRELAIEGGPTTTSSTAQDPKTPTHVLGAKQRGHETGTVVVVAKMGIRVPAATSGSIGKLMKSLYKKKYDLPADWNGFVKRQTLLHGRPVVDGVFLSQQAVDGV